MIEIVIGALVVAVVVIVPVLVGKIVEPSGDAMCEWFIGACVIFLLSVAVTSLYGIGGLVMGAVR